jgi:hypothetical protein
VDCCLSFCPFSVGHCVVLLRLTDYDYPFGISKLFLELLCRLFSDTEDTNELKQSQRYEEGIACMHLVESSVHVYRRIQHSGFYL